jgi:inosine-uridine nucleoside N-ribohydrolase
VFREKLARSISRYEKEGAERRVDVAWVITVKEYRVYAGTKKRSFAGMGKRWEIEHRETCETSRDAVEYIFDVLRDHPDRMVTIVASR